MVAFGNSLPGEKSRMDNSSRRRLSKDSFPGMLPGEGVHVVAARRPWLSQRRRGDEKVGNALGTVLDEGGLLILEDSAGNSTALRMDTRSGEVLWRRTFGGDAESRFVGASSVRCGGRGGGENVIIGGHAVVRYGSRDGAKRSFVQPAALKLDARSGEELWRFEATPGGFVEDDGGGGSVPMGGEVLGVVTDPGGDVFLVGYHAESLFQVENPAPEATSFVSKLDGLTGRLLWTRENRRVLYDYFLLSVVSDAEGNVIAAGYSNFPSRVGDKGDHDYLVVKFDSHGRALWEHRVGGASDEGYFSVAVDRVNDVYLGGRGGVWGSGAPGVFRPVVHKRAGRDGRNLWTYEGAPGSNSAFLGVEFDEASGVVVCSGSAKATRSLTEGAIGAGAEEELALAFVDSKNGEELGTWVYNTTAEGKDVAVVLVAVSPDRSVDIGGYRSGGSGAAGTEGAPRIGLSLRKSQRELASSGDPTSSPTAAPEGLPTESSESLSVLKTLSPSPYPSSSASSIALTDQGTDGDSSSSIFGVEVADWVVPVVSGVIAAALFLIVVACACWCRGRRTKFRSKANTIEMPASHEPQAFADPQRHSMAPAGIVLISSTSSTGKDDDDRGDTPKGGGVGVVGGDPKIDQIAVEDSTEKPAVPSSGRTVPTATATSAASSSCGSPPEKPGSSMLLSGPANATSALNGETGSGHQRQESFDVSSGGDAELSPIGTQLVRDDSEGKAPLPAHQSAEPPSAGGSPEKGAEKEDEDEDAGKDEDATAEGEAKQRGDNGRDFIGAGAEDAGGAEGSVDDASDRGEARSRQAGVQIDAFAAPLPGQMPALLTPDHDCLLELEDGFDGSVDEEDIPAGTSMTWDGSRGIPRAGSDDYGDVSEDRSSLRSMPSMRSVPSSYLRRFSSDQNDSSLRSNSQDQDYSGRSLDDVSLSSMQMPELLSPPFPGMLPAPPSTFSTSGTNPYDLPRAPGEQSNYGGRSGGSSGTGAPPPAFYGKPPSGAGYFDVSLFRSSSSVGSQTQTDKSSPVPGPRGIYRPPRAPAWAESGAVPGGGTSKPKRLSDPPSYETLRAMSSDAPDSTSLTQDV